MDKISVLFVCLGNICRSPTAESVFFNSVEKQGLGHLIAIDSAGTSDWHVGKKPDSRTVSAAKTRHYDLSALRGRQVVVEDFECFDFILAMDQDNLQALEQLKPNNYKGHLGLFLDFSSQSEYNEVPDPYHGGARGFDLVLDLVEDACSGLLVHIKKQQQIR